MAAMHNHCSESGALCVVTAVWEMQVQEPEKDRRMFDSTDGTAFNHEQGARSRKLFAAVVLAALDDAIADDKKFGNGPDQIARWARSRDGREVLSCAGIDPNERVVNGLMEFVSRGVRTSVALSREESERRNQAALLEAAAEAA